uniref:Uncharacterized protein n=1 Tax=Zooxanthella nutricula TaxID=1333877 RepID=A0A6U9EV01_9DINO|mmetsp:Transcript_26001/g.78354  ORF Transcript_26001/g.78354 Transcript_26001/m.78354 type:complete len:522 (+) Transcript_26001:251-1816(+)
MAVVAALVIGMVACAVAAASFFPKALDSRKSGPIRKAEATPARRLGSGAGRAEFLHAITFSEEKSDSSEGDIREDSRGAYIYPTFHFTEDPPSAIRGFAFVKGEDAAPPRGFEKVDFDLNKDARGSYNYLCVTREGDDRPVTRAEFIIRDEELSKDFVPASWDSWEVFPQDLLEGGGGKYVYLRYTREVYRPGQFLWNSPFLMTHLSATALMKREPVNAHRQTQLVGLREQLDCGARALNLQVAVPIDQDGEYEFSNFRFYRTYFKERTGLVRGQDRAYWQSGGRDASDALSGVVEWSRAHPDELVLIVLSNCFGGVGRTTLGGRWEMFDCADDRLMDAFARHGLKIETSCARLGSMTLQEAREAARMEGGGRILVVPGESSVESFQASWFFNLFKMTGEPTKFDGCVAANRDYGVKDEKGLRPYVDRAMKASKYRGRMFQVQAFARPPAGVPLDTSINAAVAAMAAGEDAVIKGVNLLEIDRVCHMGPQISASLGTALSDADVGKCKKQCDAAYAAGFHR